MPSLRIMYVEPLQPAACSDVPDEDQWLVAVEGILNGKDFERSLIGHTADGLDIYPLYGPTAVTERSVSAPAPRPHGRWDIRSAVRIDTTDIAPNSLVLDELENGATSLEIVGSGDLSAALEGVMLDLAPIGLRAGTDAFVAAETLADLAVSYAANRASPAVGGSVGVDPLNHLIAYGWWSPGIDESWKRTSVLMTDERLAPFRIATSSGAAVNAAGASEAQEIAFILASAIETVRGLDSCGISPAEAAGRIELDVTADVDVFLTIAKLRALRRCWFNVLNELEASTSASITARSALQPLTTIDPWVNLLRGTAAAFGAVTGGADTVIITPFDGVDRHAGPLGRRLARNTQLLLQDESMIGFVTDPTGGSWYVEDMTSRLAERAWEIFQSIEATGGALAYIRSGALAGALAPMATRRGRRVADRRRPITGVSEFPLLDERRPSSGSALKPPVPPADAAIVIEALPHSRLAEPFETLRANADVQDKRPTVWIETIGPLANHAARVGFAINALAVGGIAARQSAADGDFTASGCRVAFVCGADSDYRQQAVEVVTKLKRAGAEHVYLAGAPGELETALSDAGADGFLVSGDDLIVFLTELHQRLGVTA